MYLFDGTKFVKMRNIYLEKFYNEIFFKSSIFSYIRLPTFLKIKFVVVKMRYDKLIIVYTLYNVLQLILIWIYYM